MSAWIGKAAATSSPISAGDRDQAFDPSDALIGEAAGFLEEGRDAVADLRAGDAGPSAAIRPETSRPPMIG